MYWRVNMDVLLFISLFSIWASFCVLLRDYLYSSAFSMVLQIHCWCVSLSPGHQWSPWLSINRCILGIDTKTNRQILVTWPPNIQTSSSTSTPASLEDLCKFACVVSLFKTKVFCFYRPIKLISAATCLIDPPKYDLLWDSVVVVFLNTPPAAQWHQGLNSRGSCHHDEAFDVSSASKSCIWDEIVWWY